MSLAFVVPALAAGENAADGPPAFGKWTFTSKDNTGLVWSGTLGIAKLDPVQFSGDDPKKYFAMCSLDIVSTDPSKGTKGVEARCEWNSGTRAVKWGDRYPATNVYSAVLSADGKALTQGKWVERNMNGGEVGAVVLRGEWSAKLSNK